MAFSIPPAACLQESTQNEERAILSAVQSRRQALLHTPEDGSEAQDLMTPVQDPQCRPDTNTLALWEQGQSMVARVLTRWPPCRTYRVMHIATVVPSTESVDVAYSHVLEASPGPGHGRNFTQVPGVLVVVSSTYPTRTWPTHGDCRYVNGTGGTRHQEVSGRSTSPRLSSSKLGRLSPRLILDPQAPQRPPTSPMLSSTAAMRFRYCAWS
jgi:hypothetical protein